MASTGLASSITTHARDLLPVLERTEGNNYLCCPPSVLRIILRASQLSGQLAASSSSLSFAAAGTTPPLPKQQRVKRNRSPVAVAAAAAEQLLPAPAPDTEMPDPTDDAISSKPCDGNGDDGDDDAQRLHRSVMGQAWELLREALALDVGAWAARVARPLDRGDRESRMHVAEAHRAAAALYILQVFFPSGSGGGGVGMMPGDGGGGGGEVELPTTTTTTAVVDHDPAATTMAAPVRFSSHVGIPPPDTPLSSPTRTRFDSSALGGRLESELCGGGGSSGFHATGRVVFRGLPPSPPPSPTTPAASAARPGGAPAMGAAAAAPAYFAPAVTVTAEQLAAKILEHLDRVPPTDAHFKATAWPTFVAGAASGSILPAYSGGGGGNPIAAPDFIPGGRRQQADRDLVGRRERQERREQVLRRLRMVWDCCPWGYVFTAVETLREVWRIGDEEEERLELETQSELRAAVTRATQTAAGESRARLGVVAEMGELLDVLDESAGGIPGCKMYGERVGGSGRLHGGRDIMALDGGSDLAMQDVEWEDASDGAAAATTTGSFNSAGGLERSRTPVARPRQEVFGSSFSEYTPWRTSLAAGPSEHDAAGEEDADRRRGARGGAVQRQQQVARRGGQSIAFGLGWRQGLRKSGFDCLIV